MAAPPRRYALPQQRRLAELCRALVSSSPTGSGPAGDADDSGASVSGGTHIEYIQQDINPSKQAAGDSNVRVTLVDSASGDHLSWATVLDQQLRFGSSTFLCGGIGGVATPEEHRRKGHSTTVMEAAVQYMRDQHYPMTYLFGINNYYEAFGYASVGVSESSRLIVKSSFGERLPPEAGAGYSVRRAVPSDAAAITTLSALDSPGRTATLVRTEENVAARLRDEAWASGGSGWGIWGASPWVVRDAEGSPVAFFVLREDAGGSHSPLKLAAIAGSAPSWGADNIGECRVSWARESDGTGVSLKPRCSS